jgi:16S rRNA (guanine(966)-N(2))-methyltransferase RsmD
MMRIITGRARGIKLNTLEGEKTRPTSERAKEAVFSMIQFDIEGREVLDLFAGSGHMGLEAVSRGANSATFIDKSRDAAKTISQNIEKTRLADSCRLLNSDVNDFIRIMRGKKKYDVVFIDPPYALCAVAPTLKALLDADMLKSTSIIVCESEESDIFENDAALAEHFEVIKCAKYGVAHITIVKPLI